MNSRGLSRGIWIAAALVLVIAAATLLWPAAPARPYTLTLDGAPWEGGILAEDGNLPKDGSPAEDESPAEDGSPAEGERENLRVIVTVDGTEAAVLPFTEPHTLRIVQPGIGENTVILSGSGVRMESSDCPNQDCVGMGEITAENLETRAMGGFIVCLPHRLAVEVRER